MFGENNDKKVVTIDISYGLIVKGVLLVFGFLFLFLIRDIIGILLVSILLTTSITPFVDFINKKKKLPRWFGILIVYIGIIGIFALVIGLLFPALAREFKTLLDKLPFLFQNFSSNFFSSIDSPDVQNTLRQSILDLIKGGIDKIQTMGGSTIFKSFGGIISGFSFFFMTLIITFYMTMEEDGANRLVRALVPKKWHTYALSLMNKIQKTVVSWLKGQLSLSLIIGILCYIALIILGINYSLLLALVAGVVEIIPYIGPMLGAIPAIFIALTQSPMKALFVIIVYIIIQQLENNLIVPRVMKKSVGLNPIIVILVVLVGIKLAGIAGALLAVPITAILQVIANEFFHLDQEGIFRRTEKEPDETTKL